MADNDANAVQARPQSSERRRGEALFAEGGDVETCMLTVAGRQRDRLDPPSTLAQRSFEI